MVFTWSENPYSDMWHQLMFLSNKNNAKKLLSGEIKTGRTICYEQGAELERKSTQISFGISQASEYYRAAESASIATSPLLYFYGMLALAKSLIVADKKDVYFEDIKYHGLTQNPSEDEQLVKYRATPESWELEREFAVTLSGVAKHLTEVVCGFQFPDYSVITFKDILSFCPEISQMYELYYGEPARIASLYSSEELSKDPYKVRICPVGTDEKEILARIPELANDFDLSKEILHSQARIFTSRNLTKFPEGFGLYNASVGGRYVVSGLRYRVGPNCFSRYVDQMVADYLGFYILSMCVRYQQDFWGKIVQGETSGVIGLVELYLSVVKRRFPNFVLDRLFGEKFEYGTPARWA